LWEVGNAVEEKSKDLTQRAQSNYGEKSEKDKALHRGDAEGAEKTVGSLDWVGVVLDVESGTVAWAFVTHHSTLVTENLEAE
jgi:hypothetical protein